MKLLQEIGEITNMKIEQKIPEGWSVKKLGDICIKIGDGIHTTPQYTDNSDFYFINGNNIQNGKIAITQDTKNITETEYLKYKQELSLNTLLMSINGTIGSLAFYKDEKVLLGKSAAYLNFTNRSIQTFIYFYLQTNLVKIKLYSELTGSTIKNLSLASLRALKILLPPLPEQEKIAGILSCWDDGIEKLSALIEKKKIQKKALMQQLLTGKHRLKGFSTPWHEVRLEDIATITTGTSKAQYIDESGDYFVVDMGSVSNEATLIAKKRTSYDVDFLNVNDIIMPKDDIGGGNIIGKCIIVSENRKYILGDHVFKIVIKNNFPLFICLKINSFEINKYMKRCATGSAQLGLSKKDVSKCLLYIPSDLAEQKAIAEILSKADEEIELLNKKLEAFKQEKKALMQQLLTGKIRVKVN